MHEASVFVQNSAIQSSLEKYENEQKNSPIQKKSEKRSK